MKKTSRQLSRIARPDAPTLALIVDAALSWLDEVGDEPGSVWVQRLGEWPGPRRLTDLFEREWLAQFTLGQLQAEALCDVPCAYAGRLAGLQQRQCGLGVLLVDFQPLALSSDLKANLTSIDAVVNTIDGDGQIRPFLLQPIDEFVAKRGNVPIVLR